MRLRSTSAAYAAACSSLLAIACGTETSDGLSGPGPVTPVASFGPSPGARPNDAGAGVIDGATGATDARPPTAPPPAKPDSGTPVGTPPAPPAPPGPPTPAGNPCESVVCGTNETCVPFAHGQPLGVCVATCDCNNCGNCGGDNADGRWDDMQEYCGNPGASPATATCTRKCESGGCIPFGATSICWPLEGCFSL